jgi:hypothetical protein
MKPKLERKLTAKNVLSYIQIQIGIKTAIVAFLGWTIGSWFSHITDRPNNLISGLWCTMTAIVVLQTHLGGTYKTSWIRFLGVILGSIIGAFSTAIFGSNPLTLSVSIFLLVMLCFILDLKDSIRISCMSVTVVMVLWGLQPNVSPWTFAFFRTIDSILGILIAVFVAHLVWPFQAKDMLRSNMSQAIGFIRILFGLSLFNEHKNQSMDEEYDQIKIKLDELLQENILKLEETKIELWTNQELFEDYRFLHGRLQHMRKLIITLGRVYGYAKKIVDPELMEQLKVVLDLLDRGLAQLSTALIDYSQTVSLTELSEAHKKLTQELIRFRNKRLTRQFDLPEVEGFYVFFYNLDIFLKAFSKVVDILKKSEF